MRKPRPGDGAGFSQEAAGSRAAPIQARSSASSGDPAMSYPAWVPFRPSSSGSRPQRDRPLANVETPWTKRRRAGPQPLRRIRAVLHSLGIPLRYLVQERFPSIVWRTMSSIMLRVMAPVTKPNTFPSRSIIKVVGKAEMPYWEKTSPVRSITVG